MNTLLHRVRRRFFSSPVPADDWTAAAGARIHPIVSRTTPVFIANTKVMEDRLSQLEGALMVHWPTYHIAYSFKTNTAVARRGVLRSLGCWAEVVSPNEYALAKTQGYNGSAIILNGPHKKTEDLAQAVADGATVHIDSQEELERLIGWAKRIKKNVSVGLRIRTALPGLAPSRFGFSVDNGEAAAALRILSLTPRIRLTSIHSHIGSDVDDPRHYRAAAKAAGAYALLARRITGIPIRSIDLGGGFPVVGTAPYARTSWRPQPIDRYVQAMHDGLTASGLRPADVALIIEPGRYLVDEAVVFVSRIIGRREEGGVQQLTTDATVSMLPLTSYRPQIVRLLSSQWRTRSGAASHTMVYGASCREDDVLYRGVLPVGKVGDYLLHRCVGAYNQSMGTGFMFAMPDTVFL